MGRSKCALVQILMIDSREHSLRWEEVGLGDKQVWSLSI